MGRGADGPETADQNLPAPNNPVEPTPNSLRSCVAPAVGRGSPGALGEQPTRLQSYGVKVPCRQLLDSDG